MTTSCRLYIIAKQNTGDFMKSRYKVEDIIANPFSKEKITLLDMKANQYVSNKNRLFKILLCLFPIIYMGLIFGSQQLSKIEEFKSLPTSTWFFYIFLFAITFGVLVSIYSAYEFYASPLKVVVNRDSRTVHDMPIDQHSFKHCEHVDMAKINGIEKLRNFYERIVEQKRPLYNFEYEIILEIDKKINNL